MNGMSIQLDKAALEIVTKMAVQAALEYLESEKLKAQKTRRDRRLRNTRLLLKNYRAFVVHCRDVEADLNNLNDPAVLEELDTEELALESIKRSKERTLAMVQYVNHMLEAYRIICEKSNKPEEIRRFRTIQAMYISDPKQSAEQIAEEQGVDVRTVYKDLNKACMTLSGLIFGVDGIRMLE